jgi:hypothetical protein
MKTLLLASHDRGGANVMAALLRHSCWLSRQKILLFLEGPSLAVLDNKAAQFGSAQMGNAQTEAAQTLRISSLAEAESFQPDLVICGTSFNAELERNVILWASERAIPTLSLIDSWMNLSARYWHSRLNRYCLPSVVSVVDHQSRQRLVAELGELSPRIEVTGQPHLQGLMSLPFEPAVSEGNQVKRVLFCSEPMRQAYNRDGELGYDQFSVFEQLLTLFERETPSLASPLASPLACQVVLELKLHPSEDPQSWDEFLARHPGSSRVKLVRTQDELALAFKRVDVVLGLISMALVEAALAGKPVYSCQFGRKQRLAEEITRYMMVCESTDELWRCFQAPTAAGAGPRSGLAAVLNQSHERLEAVCISMATQAPGVLPHGH